LTNSTTIDTLAGQPILCACLPEGVPSKKKFVNLYDRGVIANVRNFFNADLFGFWLANENISESDGTVHPINPYCTFKDI